ncbi:MAG TPA: hypothetical protein VES88_05110 [Gemmatimonadaceae bacterium]|nr:hypothetical protein [Gemmatimonadaceae bacterium]
MDVFYREAEDRWVRGDRFIRAIARSTLPRKPRYPSGMQMVVRNFLRGLERRQIRYRFNPLPILVPRSAPVISFGLGAKGVEGLRRGTPVIAAIGWPLPPELPSLCRDHNVRKYLQHSAWVLDLAKAFGIYDPAIFDLWPAGIDTREWIELKAEKDVDVLIYDKLYFERRKFEAELLQPVREYLHSRGYSSLEIRYGDYSPAEYRSALSRAKSMLFLSAHESQGLAYQECLSSNIPVIAWNPGVWLDPSRFSYGMPVVPATSVPFFDGRCGSTFRELNEFPEKFESFMEGVASGDFAPRQFVLDCLSIEKSTERMLEIHRSVTDEALALPAFPHRASGAPTESLPSNPRSDA